MSSVTKKCNKCEKRKPISSFHLRGNGLRRASCKSCYLTNRVPYRLNNKDKIRARGIKWYKKHGHIKRTARIAKYASDDKLRNRVLKQSKEYYKVNKETALARMSRYRRKLKLDVIEGYGGKCTCPGGCPITEPDFLTIEHLDKDGKAHRASGVNTHADIRRRGFPPEYTIHCFNCNIAKSLFGTCPHQRKLECVS